MSETAAAQVAHPARKDTDTPDGLISPSDRPFTYELGIISALWWRDMLRLLRERTRWLGVVLQPVLFWLIIGGGLSETFAIEGAQGVSYLEYFFPGVLVMIVLFTTIFATMAVIEDRQTGFLQGVLVAPGSPLSLVVGKVAGVTTIALIQSAIFLLLAPLAGYPLAAVSWPLLLLVIVLSCAGLAAMNLAAAWLFPSTQSYHALMSVVLLPLWVVSGAMFPAPEGALGALMRVNPLFYMVEGARYGLGSGGLTATAPSLGVCLAVVLGFSVLCFALASRICRR
jgi:daunorubicin resistance ABC transporter membrane protein